MADIKLKIDGHELSAELYDCDTANALLAGLPLTVYMSRWGEEYYGCISELDVAQASDARDVMRVGELAYWLPGTALCIFFGPTPASEGDESRAASNVNPLGQLIGDVSIIGTLGPSVSVVVSAS